MNAAKICLVIAIVLFVVAGAVYYGGDPYKRGWGIGWIGAAFFAGSFLI